jgi:hypothetical protein
VEKAALSTEAKMYNNRYTGRIDLTGKKFGRLTVLKALPKVNFMYYWEVQCDCGTIKKSRWQSFTWRIH